MRGEYEGERIGLELEGVDGLFSCKMIESICSCKVVADFGGFGRLFVQNESRKIESLNLWHNVDKLKFLDNCHRSLSL